MDTGTLQTTHNVAELLPYYVYIYPAIAFFCGCVAATAELFSRYSDGPVRIFRFKESYFYLGLNGISSLIVYTIVKQYDISFGPFGNSPLCQAILAGFSAMVILRSSLASIKLGQSTFQAGFAPIMQAFLDKVDRAFDRKRSKADVAEVKTIMKDVDFTKAAKSLPQTCLNLMRNVSTEETDKMGREVADLEKSEFNSQARMATSIPPLMAT